MTAFQIYALALVIIYIVYYIVIIGWELQHPHLMYSPENAFGFSTRYVNEIDNWTYSVSDGTETVVDYFIGTDYDNILDQPEDVTVEEHPEEEPPSVVDYGEDDEDDFETYDKLRQTQEEMMTVYPEFEETVEEYDADEFAVVMNQPPDVNRKILREITRY